MKNKKAITTKLLIYGILTLFFLAFFIQLVVDISLSEEQYGLEQLCWNSVKIASYKISGKSIYNELKCPTQYQTIEAKEDEAIKHEIAEKMRTCYWMFHEGKLELFEENAENFCVICYVIDFKEKKQVNGVVSYLINNELSEEPGTTYYDYLTPYSTTPELIKQIQDSKEDSIDTNYKYAIMFNYMKPSYLSKLEAGEIGAGTGAVAGGGAVVGGIALLNLIPGVNIATIPITIVGAGMLGGVTGFFFGQSKGNTADWSSAIMLWPYTEEEAQRLQCTHAPVKTK